MRPHATAEKRAELDEQFVKSFVERIRGLYPGCPPDRENSIAEHACLKYSDRVGRTGSAKKLDEKAVQLAVTAHIRHAETKYDGSLAKGHGRREARNQVKEEVGCILSKWKTVHTAQVKAAVELSVPYINPSSLKLKYLATPIMIWSWNFKPMSLAILSSFSVKLTSSGLGSGSPEG